VDAADELAMAALDPRQLDRLIELLDVVRAANAERGAPRSLARAE
jgi:hypothetical protein